MEFLQKILDEIKEKSKAENGGFLTVGEDGNMHPLLPLAVEIFMKISKETQKPVDGIFAVIMVLALIHKIEGIDPKLDNSMGDHVKTAFLEILGKFRSVHVPETHPTVN